MMLIHDHKSYTTHFRKMAQFHKSIRHSSNKPAFARMNLSSHPMLAREDIQEFLRAMKNKLTFPALLLNTYTAKTEASPSYDSKRKLIQGEFFILDRYNKDDFEAQEVVFDETEEIGNDILAFLGEYYEENEGEGFFVWDDSMQEKISNLEVDNLAGTKFYFTISIPNQVALNLNIEAFDTQLFEE